ncbi:MAG: metallophosphoesterase [Anaerolineae bacterium]
MTDYAAQVAQRLAEVYTGHSVIETADLDALRIVLCSDLHKGQRDKADDFLLVEPTYLAALERYWQDGYALVLLGDVEELWECWPEPVVREYQEVLQREGAFAAVPGRYRRLVGNHDDLWYDSEEVARHLGPYLAGGAVVEGVRLAVHEGGQALGELFLVHGHHGSRDADRFAPISRLIVRYIWRPIQRVLNIRTSTPSNDFELRQEHELAMYGYAAGRRGLVLVAGHTHHPVWEGLGLEQAVQREVEAGAVMPQVDTMWLREQEAGAVTLPGKKPCYFNTGCCSYSDGSMTAIEIAEGEIRLVRWEGPAEPVRQVLFRASLREVLAAVAG